MLAAATRNIGALIWALVMWEWLRAQGWRLSEARKAQTWRNLFQGLTHNWLEVANIGIIPLGLFGYMYFLKEHFQTPLAFVETKAAWGREFQCPLSWASWGAASGSTARCRPRSPHCWGRSRLSL